MRGEFFIVFLYFASLVKNRNGWYMLKMFVSPKSLSSWSMISIYVHSLELGKIMQEIRIITQVEIHDEAKVGNFICNEDKARCCMKWGI